jgi:hypothetical protein
MIDSLYLGPQIEARNRWAVQQYARAEDLAARPRRQRARAAAIRAGLRIRIRVATPDPAGG